MEALIAYVPDTRIRALDSSGNPIVGATLTIYDTGTTNLASVYRDTDLATPMTNPTSGADASDSGGWFPQIFAAEGGLFDITMKTSAGVTVKAYVSVPAVGEGSGVVTRDFGTSRVWIGNRGGVIRFEGGNAEGDDVGGDVSIGGWDATQADTIELDAAASSTTGDFDVGGTFTENGKILPGVVSASGSSTSAASVIIPLATGATVWDVDITNAEYASDILQMQISVDGGATYLSASNYVWTVVYFGTNGSTVNTLGTPGTGNVKLYPPVNGGVASLSLRFVAQSPTGKPHWYGRGGDNGTAYQTVAITGACTATVAPVTHIKLSAAGAAPLSCAWRVTPLRF